MGEETKHEKKKKKKTTTTTTKIETQRMRVSLLENTFEHSLSINNYPSLSLSKTLLHHEREIRLGRERERERESRVFTRMVRLLTVMEDSSPDIHCLVI